MNAPFEDEGAAVEAARRSPCRGVARGADDEVGDRVAVGRRAVSVPPRIGLEAGDRGPEERGRASPGVVSVNWSGRDGRVGLGRRVETVPVGDRRGRVRRGSGRPPPAPLLNPGDPIRIGLPGSDVGCEVIWPTLPTDQPARSPTAAPTNVASGDAGRQRAPRVDGPVQRVGVDLTP